MVFKNINVNVNNNSTSSSPSIVLYKKDRGILLNIKLNNLRFKISEIGRVDVSVNNVNSSFVLKNLKFEDNNILLPISHDSNEWRNLEIGTYKVHLHIYDANLNRISTPSFDIVCKDTIY